MMGEMTDVAPVWGTSARLCMSVRYTHSRVHEKVTDTMFLNSAQTLHCDGNDEPSSAARPRAEPQRDRGNQKSKDSKQC